MELAIIRATNALFNIIYFLVVVDVFASWLPFLYSNRTTARILYMIHSLTGPVINPVRKLINKTPMGRMPIDFSPVIVLLLLDFVRYIVLTILMVLLYGRG